MLTELFSSFHLIRSNFKEDLERTISGISHGMAIFNVKEWFESFQTNWNNKLKCPRDMATSSGNHSNFDPLIEHFQRYQFKYFEPQWSKFAHKFFFNLQKKEK